ncbi:MAG: aminotransferase class V-fold PLP-dependent enzyme [Alicyclobacillus sp.]|nr:aminotransferase class V-fold PLP-dependent enzyme [Alicyclobacillus sp.]
MALVDNVRRHFPAVRTSTYLNTATFGAIPDVAAERMKERVDDWTQRGRLHGYWQELAEVQAGVVEQLAALLHVPETSIALTDSTTHGINIVLWGLDLQPGDEVLYSTTEHAGGMMPVFAQRLRRGVTLRQFEVSRSADDTLAAFRAALTPRTRLVVCSHVSYETGQRLPIERIALTAHQQGVLCLVDGAQGAGAEYLDLGSTKIDFYAFPGQKWLCGPDGVGALFVRPGVQARLHLTYVGGASLHPAQPHSLEGYFLPKPGARRFEHGFTGLPSWAGWLESLRFARVQVGWDYVYTRIHGLSGALLDHLLDVSGVEVLTPRESRAGIVSFRVRDVPASRIVSEAAERGIWLRNVEHLNVVRASTAYYNSEDDVERLVTFLQKGT